MSSRWLFVLLPAALLLADDTASNPSPPPAWSTKPAAEWSQDEAKKVLSDSPWAKQVTPSFVRGTQSGYNNGPRRPMGRRGGISFPGGGYPGGGYPGGGGGYPGGQRNPNNPPPQDDSKNGAYDEKPPLLTVRWESAQPVRLAELKRHDEDAPTLADETHYAIAVYGIPANMVAGDFKTLADEAKKKTTLSRDGKKDMKPSSVQILRRENGPVVLFLFVKSKDKKEAIGKEDRRVQFDTVVGRLALSQAFYLEDMIFQGKTEL